MKTIEKLINAKKDTVIGNHSVEVIHWDNGIEMAFYYHDLCICQVDFPTRRIWFEHGRNVKNPHTLKVIKEYRERFKDYEIMQEF